MWIGSGIVVFLSAQALAGEALKVEAGLTLFRAFVDSPLSQSKSISDYVSGTVINGTALTQGTATVDFLPWADGAALALRLHTETNSHAVGVNIPRRDIAVNIHSSAYTVMSSVKPLYLYPDRLATAAAQSSASTQLFYEGINVDASGLFWRLKERVAYQRAWETAWATKAQNEYRASVQATQEINGLLDSRMSERLPTLNRDYRNIFYRPFFLEGGLSGRLALSTTATRLAARVMDTEKDGPSPSIHPDSALAVKVAARLPSYVLSKEVAGRTMNETDLAELLILAGLPATVPKGPSTLSVVFPKQNAVRVEFADGELTVRLVAESVALGKERVDGAELALHFSVDVTTTGRLRLKQTGISIEGSRGGTVSAAFVVGVPDKIAAIVPDTMEVGYFTLPGKLGHGGSLRVKRAAVENDWAVVEWEYR